MKKPVWLCCCLYDVKCMMIKIQTVAYGMWCNPYFQDRALVHYISYQELVKLQPISVGRMTLIFVRPYLDTVNYYTRGYHFQSLQCKIFVTFTIPVWSILYSSLTSVISNDLVITLFTDLDLSFISCWTWREEHGGFYMLSFGDAHRQMEDM